MEEEYSIRGRRAIEVVFSTLRMAIGVNLRSIT